MDIQGKSVSGRRKPQMPRSRGSSRHSILKKPQRSVEQSKQGRGVVAECEGLQATELPEEGGLEALISI